MADIFELKVKQQIDRLTNQSCRVIEAEVIQKRIAWLNQNYVRPGQDFCPTPRQAYELLFFDYMGLVAADVPVISETATEIVWRSLNPCPTLAACQSLGLDTRRICRGAYEKSTQAFVSYLDPQLRFLRSYEEIRPYANHCREMIVRVNFAEMMQIAWQEAKISRQEGNKGYGAVVAWGNRVLSQAHDTAVTAKDPSFHAELQAIRQAVQVLGDPNLSGAVLFSTCEPCPMCASLAVWANLTTIVYGISIEETARLGKARIMVSSREIVEKSPVIVEIIGDVLKEKCRLLYE
jgi:tRNA(adenine34) deaminase